MPIKIHGLAFVMAGLTLSALTIYFLLPLFYPELFGYGMFFVAVELSEKPERYMVLTEPDRYVLEATSNPGEWVFVGGEENSDFDELVSTYQTNNVEIDGRYYRINMYIRDLFFPPILFVGWLAFGVVTMVWKLMKLSSERDH